MATIRYELSTKVTNAKGKERWHKMGVVFMGENGPFAVIDNIPVGFSGVVSFFEPKEKEEKAKPSEPLEGDDPPF